MDKKIKKLNFQEKILIFIKKTKPKNGKYVAILTPLIIIALVLSAWLTRTEDTKAVAEQAQYKAKMTLVGDLMLGRFTENIVDKHGADYLFEHVQPYLKDSDYMTGNLDVPILTKDESQYESLDKDLLLSTDKRSLKSIKNAGFSVLNLANNNAMNYGEKGLKDTLASLQEEGIDSVGAGANESSAKKVSYQDVNGLKVATLGFTDVRSEGTEAKKNKAGVVYTDPDALFNEIEKAKDPKQGNADLVVVNVQWGQEYDMEPSPRQEALAKAMVDAGADMIAGHHPHVLSSFDVYKDSVIFYSLGNFVSDQGWSNTKNTALAQYKLKEDGTAYVDVVPLRIEEGSPRPVDNWWYKKQIFNSLTKGVSKGVLWEQKDDKIRIFLNHNKVIDKS
jgi:poly-gamma-glutamate synthesis protein (capsule biosynthesis protein)